MHRIKNVIWCLTLPPATSRRHGDTELKVQNISHSILAVDCEYFFAIKLHGSRNDTQQQNTRTHKLEYHLDSELGSESAGCDDRDTGCRYNPQYNSSQSFHVKPLKRNLQPELVRHEVSLQIKDTTVEVIYLRQNRYRASRPIGSQVIPNEPLESLKPNPFILCEKCTLPPTPIYIIPSFFLKKQQSFVTQLC